MATTLTPNAISNLIRTSYNKETFKPIVQAINIKKVISSNNAPNRYRIIISDGVHFMQGMLASQLNKFFEGGNEGHELVENSVIVINEFIMNSIQDKSVVILLGLTVLYPAPSPKIGDPVDYSSVPVGRPSTATPIYGVPPPAPAGGNSNYSNPYSNASPSGSSSAPVARSMQNDSNIIPISALNPYQNRWTIKGRITNKGDLRRWSNAKGEGTLFSIDILDSSGMDIRGTFFKDDADKWYPVLEANKVYTFSGGKLKVANAQYNKCKCGHEITFDRGCEIKLVNDDASIVQNTYSFVKISHIADVAADEFVDILCVVTSVSPVTSLIAKKSGKELMKCELTCIDDSNCEITCTVWGEEKCKSAEADYAGYPVVAMKSVKVGDFGGKSLGSGGASIIINPTSKEASDLKKWFASMSASGDAQPARKKLSGGAGAGGNRDTFESRKSVTAIKDDGLGHNDKPDYVSFKGTINFIKKDKEGGPWYPACPNPEDPCKSRCKVVQTADSHWSCEKCNKQYPECVRRFILSMTIIDNTSCCWASVFNEEVELMLGGKTADTLNLLLENGDYPGFNAPFDEILHTDYVFTCRVKNEIVQDEARVKTTVQRIKALDYVEESRNLIEAIGKLRQ